MIELTSENHKDLSAGLNDAEIVILYFWAPWCGPCKQLKPILEEVERKYDDRIAFVKVNIDEESEISRLYEVKSIPTLLLLRKGLEYARTVGVQPAEKIEFDFALDLL